MKEPVLQGATPERNKEWVAEVTWSNGLKDAIDLKSLLLDVKVDFYFVDLGVIESLQETFEEHIAPSWEERPNVLTRSQALFMIKQQVRSMFSHYIAAGYLRETIHESSHWDHRKGSKDKQSTA